MENKSNKIDYLYEDPEIVNQKYALISIVGPNMPQKCDVWGIKVRGSAENLEKAKELSQKLLKIDKHYDVYTVEVGKFFPLQVEPHEISDIEYQNDQLNSLVKNYLQNKETANEFWHQRKNDLIEDAIKQGQSQEEKPEHPVAILHRIKNYNQTLQEMKESMTVLQQELDKANDKFTELPEDVQTSAKDEFEKLSLP